MSSTPNHYPSSFPTVPASLSTGDHGMRDHYAEQEHTTERPYPHSLSGITPYLGLRARLSQVWINRWTILLLLVLVRVLIAIGSLNNDLGSAKVRALSACSSVESMGSAMASMPHYMAQGTNELAAKGVEKAVDGLQSMLFLAVTAFEEIFVFVINMLYGTYECLITLAVGTAGHAAIALAKEVTDFLNKTIGEVTDDLSKLGGKIENTLEDAAGSIGSIFGGAEDKPDFNIQGPLDKLKNIKIPTKIQDELKKLDENIPTFDEVHNATNQVLRMPFELIKNEMREHLGNFTFDKSAFPVPQRKQLDFCSDDDGINGFFDGLHDTAEMAKKVFIAVLLIAAIAVCIPVFYMELRRWKVTKERAVMVQENNRDPLDVIYLASRPHSGKAGLKLSRNFSSQKKQDLTRWFIAYATSTPALLVLSLAVAGLLSCLCQYILLQAVRKQVPGLVGQVGEFANKVVNSLDDASNEWANGTNSVILAENKKINENMLGWVGTSTTAVNDTLNSFVSETTKLLDTAFGKTILYEPIKGIFDCLIGLKVVALQKGLTWAKDHAHVDFPLFANDTFSAGASKALASSGSDGSSTDSFMADPGSGVTDKITEAIFDLTQKLIEGIRTEALISTAVLCLYFLIVIIGGVAALVQLSRSEPVRGEGGATYAGDISNPTDIQHRTHASPSDVAQTPGAAPAYDKRFSNYNEATRGGHYNEKDQWTNDDINAHGHTGPQQPSYGVVDEKRRSENTW